MKATTIRIGKETHQRLQGLMLSKSMTYDDLLAYLLDGKLEQVKKAAALLKQNAAPWIQSWNLLSVRHFGQGVLYG